MSEGHVEMGETGISGEEINEDVEACEGASPEGEMCDAWQAGKDIVDEVGVDGEQGELERGEIGEVGCKGGESTEPAVESIGVDTVHGEDAEGAFDLELAA